ncbi:MAG TPA: hypothetical protein VLR90_06325, partial [Blastocatellia bacterium]|nr:hypothetical protein [Blastocatellia bacterium]
AGWKKFEPMWDWLIRAKRVTHLLPMLEAILTGFGTHPESKSRLHDAEAGANNKQSDANRQAATEQQIVETGSRKLPIIQVT